MKTFQYQINGHAVSIRLDDREGTIADLLVDGEHPQVSEERMPAYDAAIALALIEHEVEVVHDDETDIITFMPQESSWNHPSQLMNRL